MQECWTSIRVQHFSMPPITKSELLNISCPFLLLIITLYIYGNKSQLLNNFLNKDKQQWKRIKIISNYF